MRNPEPSLSLATRNVLAWSSLLSWSSFIARAPQIRDRIGVTVAEFGLLLTISAVFGLVGSVLAGRVIHVATTRRVLQAGAAIMVLSLLVIGVAESPTVWLLGMFTYVLVDVWVDIAMNLQGSAGSGSTSRRTARKAATSGS